ncbi:MAG: class I SAM-dependent methyltransferase [Myxococcota bacterium]
MSKSIDHELELTEADQDAFTLRRSIVSRIEEFRAKRGLEKSEMRILDWGCGRGRTVLWLRDQGYDAYGVDVDERPIRNGRILAQKRGLDADRILTWLDPEGRSPYPDGFFHYTGSDQVFEHIPDLPLAAREIARVTEKQGGGAHIFAPRFLPVEGHLFMPCVHWLPKNRLRHAYIRAMVGLGVEPDLPSYRGMSAAERAERYYRFSCDQVFYRSPRAIRAAFEGSGFGVRFDTVNSVSVREHRIVGPFARNRLVAPLLNKVLVEALSIHLLLAR